jgi:hypothetical protein
MKEKAKAKKLEDEWKGRNLEIAMNLVLWLVIQ